MGSLGWLAARAVPCDRGAGPNGAALFREPHGFEGFGAVAEVPPTCDLPVAELVKTWPSVSSISIPLPEPSPDQVEDRHDAAICLDQLHDLRVMRVPRCEEPLQPIFSKLGMAVERPRLRYLGREDDLALRIKEGKHRLDVRLIPGVHEPRNGPLHVLLRHRSPSIPFVEAPWKRQTTTDGSKMAMPQVRGLAVTERDRSKWQQTAAAVADLTREGGRWFEPSRAHFSVARHRVGPCALPAPGSSYR